MNKILILILLILMLYIDRKRGIKLFISICLNFLILIVLFYLISLGMNPVIISLLGCFLLSVIILYFVNGKNVKTEAAFISIVIVLVILAVFIFGITKMSRIAGFGYESFEEINMFSYDVKIDFTNIAVSLVLISLIGATTDAAIAISSALYEVYDNNRNLSKRELFLSGLSIGKDILCTTTNTLLFAFLGEFMTLVIWFAKGNYSFFDIVNAKTFCSEFIKILFTAIGCVMIIPISSYVTTRKVTTVNLDEEYD